MTTITSFLLVGLAVALGIGLLIGADRERRKGAGPARAAAGLRTFAVASVAGAVSFAVGGEILLAVVTLGITILAAISYWRTRDVDPGITTEVALVLTTLLGALAMREALVAAGLGTLVAGLLHARSPLHGFVRDILSEADIRDALIFAGASLIVFPLLPDAAIGPYGALNLRSLWLIVILIMGVSSLGYILTRIAGSRFGLPLAGLASGFISSIATIAAMGERAKNAPHMLKAAAAGAVLSTVATIVQLAAVLGATSMAVLRDLSAPLLGAGIVALGYGALFMARALAQKDGGGHRSDRAFSLPAALAFAAILAVIIVASAVLQKHFGSTGALVAAAIGGLADTHAAAVSIATLVATGKLGAGDAVVPILAAFSTNTLGKMLAAAKGGNAFAIRVIPGLIAVALAAWGSAAIAWPLGP
ncbi:MgtC/SapB family protein [Reyranella sp.]|uniref:MgtC/SapB family protein n=1 Tax=Reyranella sp. TaxID=1929291 RepID=UPI002F9309EF